MAPGIPLPIIGFFTRNWWILLLRGIVAILFGILALSLPLLTLGTLVLLFGVYALVDGVVSLFGALAGWQHRENRWLLFLEGLIGLGAGFVTLRSPVITAVVLIFFMAAWALATGVVRIIGAIRLRREISGEFWLALSGIASVAFAFFVMLRPAAGALAMIWVIGWYALFMGATLVALSFKIRSLRRRTEVIEPQHRRAA
jgi:uncharacterized membrane protein HdeD (DUF308 family)